jgi:hypothetical protein
MIFAAKNEVLREKAYPNCTLSNITSRWNGLGKNLGSEWPPELRKCPNYFHVKFFLPQQLFFFLLALHNP